MRRAARAGPLGRRDVQRRVPVAAEPWAQARGGLTTFACRWGLVWPRDERRVGRQEKGREPRTRPWSNVKVAFDMTLGSRRAQGGRRALSHVLLPGANDFRAALDAIEHPDPTAVHDRRGARAALDRRPVGSDGAPDAVIAPDAPPPPLAPPLGGVDAQSRRCGAHPLSARGAAGRLDCQLGGHAAARGLTYLDCSPRNHGGRASALPGRRRQADRAAGDVERGRQAPLVAAGESGARTASGAPTEPIGRRSKTALAPRR